ncbi:hypothetical protein Clacol_009831 [Clathrus columnatus]|uniref:Ribosomal RNA-processing protein 40 n=1 Tax=Clathrus columnatus TaxID=1419009 RepID=A0AAV5ASA6_9AGAM|nr:hypothetical protein Clacol_009831 [Clathrus columnatus]
MTFVLPGDTIPASSYSTLKLGPGLLQTPAGPISRNVIATRAGVLNKASNTSGTIENFWIESNSQRYAPAAQEGVIGIVTGRTVGGEAYRVDIGSAQPAQLDGLAFEGVTKRNRPILKVGSLVYARVSLAHKDMDPELECFDAQTRRAEGFGELKGGFMIKCSLGLCRLCGDFLSTIIIVSRHPYYRLLDPRYFFLPLLGSRFPLEVAIGVNGRIWIMTPEIKQTIAVARCLEAVDLYGGNMDQDQLKTFLQQMDI